MSTHDAPGDGPAELVERLRRAVTDHDLDGVVSCFAVDYRNETPAHPSRGFTGQAQVRRSWEQIFAAVPDLTADVIRCTVQGDIAWTEWEHRGVRVDGSPHLMRGVVIFGVSAGLASWARFYLEPVVDDGIDADDAVGSLVRPERAS